jgi:CDP-2,3-bis-(O-geranylgeranyl)-sn-glycerol synthase
VDYATILRLLILLSLANGAPVIAKRILGARFARPIDGNLNFFDGRPLFGSSKTIRGILASIVATTAGAPLIGFDLTIGLLVAITAMAGDLFSSFVKRRLGLPPSSRATGLDQIPESLFPLLVCSRALALSAVDIAATAALFLIGEILLSRILFKLRIRDRPY